ncbi:BRCT domain-containing protein [Sporosarcina sp. ACRSL]|uniref:BRCT domain-containing protein n=1 Tax=Sporosarcina sp. ACRSL TaxID=2918215 RepID=UPI001EF5F1D2|nr:BRCT domain-containing protein [Sporosarcina sp. ACRSL]MCG7346511.1 BRCT domain-containing protein [Sporosarcina sp. ACRSL]
MTKDYHEVDDYRTFTAPAEVHKAVNSLIGMLNGVQFDNIVNQQELSEIINWCNLHRRLQRKFPFSEIIPLIDNALSDNILTEEEIQDILWLCKNVVHHDGFNTYYDIVTSSLQQLQGIIHGIMADNILHESEINQLYVWMDSRDFLKGFYPFDEIYSLLITVRRDGVISEDEKNLLKAYFGNFIDTRMSFNVNAFENTELQNRYSIGGICAVCPEIEFEDKVFSFTGTSGRAKRKEIAEIITNMGGSFNNNVTLKTDYLIVGNEGNPCWAFSCYGRKVEKAVDLRKNGSSIVIVHENDFWDEV